jgi:uncharacterized protein (DUF697 family)
MTTKNSKDGSSEQERGEPFISVYDELREIKASKIVNRNVLWAMGSGLIPVPLLDVGVLSLIQLKMLAALSKHYRIPFSKNIGKSAIATLVGFVTANSLRGSIVTSLMKVLPVVGFLGSVSMPIYSGAVTYAIGKIFIQHFESGGTFLTFKPYKVKKHFLKLYKEGLVVASNLQSGKL